MKTNLWKGILSSALLWWGLGASLEARVQNNESSARFLAEKIAENSGGSFEQYMSYARKLARTLSKFPEEKQRKIMKGKPLPGDNGDDDDDGNNGHGNDSDGNDDSNPGKGKGKGKEN